MPILISLLRAVNLGPKNRVRMDALRAVYESLGFTDVRTYLQSGNVVFRAGRGSLKTLGRRIEEATEEQLGIRSDVVLRSDGELAGAIANNPFPEYVEIDPSKLLVLFLADEPLTQQLDLPPAPEQVGIHGREVYIWFPNGMGRPQLSMTALGKALGVVATGRNWRTVTELMKIAKCL